MKLRFIRRYLRSKPKIFCIGANKTGTTSIHIALRQLGYRTGSVESGCRLIGDWAKDDFSSTLDLCRSGNAFQDIPFSLPGTYRHLDTAFPGSKFVLTLRNNASEWYESLIRFHTLLLGKGRLPTADDLKSFPLIDKGWLWQVQHSTTGVEEPSPYDRDTLLEYYEAHNREVQEYFESRPNRLLVLNISEPGNLQKLCDFLDIRRPSGMTMPRIDSETIVREVHDHLSAIS